MEKHTEVSAPNFEDYFEYLEEVYGGAFWAFEAGATKEELVGQIDEAFECFEEMRKDGLLITTDTTTKTSQKVPGE